MKNNKKSGFTLVELLVTVGLMVVIGSFATVSLIGSVKTQSIIKNSKDVQSQVDGAVEKIEKELKESDNSQTVLTMASASVFSAGVVNQIDNNNAGYAQSPNSIVLYNYYNKNEDGNPEGALNTRAVCLKQDIYKGKVIGQRLIQYSFENNILPVNPPANPSCTDDYMQLLFASSVYSSTFLTTALVHVNYFQATPIIMNDNPARFLDHNPDAISIRLSVVYNYLNSNPSKVGERVDNENLQQSLYTLKTTLLTK